MKKIMSAILVVAFLCMSLAGCGSNDGIQKATDKLNLVFYSDNLPYEPYNLKYQLQSTIEAYKNMYPEVKLTVEFKDINFGNDYGETSYKKYATEIMAGKSSDVILMDSTFLRVNDIYKIQNSGAFADLLPYMNKDTLLKTDNLLKGVIDSGKQQDKQYVIPTHYNLPLFFGSDSSIKNAGIDRAIFKNTTTIIEGLTAYYLNGEDKKSRVFPELKWLAYFPLYMNIKFVDREKQSIFIDNTFEKGLDFFKLTYQKEMNIPDISVGQNYSLSEQFRKGIYITSFDLYNTNLTKTIGQIREISTNEVPIVQPWQDQYGKTNAIISEVMAISNSSKNKQNAWNFMRLCFADEKLYQGVSCDGPAGFPVNQRSFKEYTEKYGKLNLSSFDDTAIPEFTTEQQDYLISMQEQIMGFVFPSQLDRDISKILIEYGEDKIAREECIEQISSYLSVYVSE